jgi:membrane protein
MSIKDQKLARISEKIRFHHQRGKRIDSLLKRVWMLYHEVVRDDVTIRAESLSYFTLFSIMPILAGLFLVVSAFSQWAPVQEDFQNLIQNILAPLPEEHRKNLIQFIFEFKEVYLAKLSKTGSSLGIFAVMVLLMIIGKVFLNLEDLMNRIWSAQKSRPWIQRLRNLVLAMVILPFSIFVALSLPGLVNHFVGVKPGLLVEGGVPAVLLLGFLYFLFRFIPNVEVAHRNALFGSLLSGVLFFFSNIFLNIYFRFGTQTAYGKAAVVPIAAFFIYVSWIIIMVGAEWSFVLQHERSYTEENLNQPNLQYAAALIGLIEASREQHDRGTAPLSEEEFRSRLGVTSTVLAVLLKFLMGRGVLVKSMKTTEYGTVFVYSFCHDPSLLNLGNTVKEFLEIGPNQQNFDVSQVIRLISTK